MAHNDADLVAEIIDLRRRRFSFGEIGARLGIDAGRACQLATRAMRGEPRLRAEELRAERLSFVGGMIRHLLAIAEDDATVMRDRLTALSQVETLMRQENSLLGLDNATLRPLDFRSGQQQLMDSITEESEDDPYADEASMRGEIALLQRVREQLLKQEQGTASQGGAVAP